MNVKSWIPLVLAAVLGLLALVVARKALNKTGGPQGTTPLVAVAVAARDLPPGRELVAEDLTVTRLPAEVMPGGSFRAAQEVVGRTTLHPLVKGQAVVEPLLTPTGTRGGITALIKPGYRAMTLEVNEFSGLAGMIQPGSRVDVIATLRDEKSQQPAARTILQKIEVRAVGRNINPGPVAEAGPPPPPSNNVTLMVTPRQAQILQLATQNGRPWLVLRNTLDAGEPEAELTTLAELRNQSDEVEPPEAVGPATAPVVTVPPVDPFAAPPAPAARVVQVIRGGVESTVTFHPGGPQSDPAIGPTTRPNRPDGRVITDVSDGVRPQ